MRRVVVTGIGIVSPIGIGVEENWNSLREGRSGVGPITHFDASSLPSRIAGEVKNFFPEKWLSPKDAKRLPLFLQYAAVAAQEAFSMAGLEVSDELGERMGVAIGSGIGGIGDIEKNTLILKEKGWKKISPYFIPYAIINMASGYVAIQFKAYGPNLSVVTACATGTHAIGEAFKMIQRGAADVMIAGGTESPITPLGVAGFSAMRALSTRNHEPEKASRPFDRERDGFVVAEGAGILILEALEHARARGAKIIAEIVGYGMSSDAFHITAPDKSGHGAAKAMKAALEDAGISPQQVDYINAHGTSTLLNDVTETRAIKMVFGDRAYKIPVSSTKSMTGHMLGAAGAAEAIYTILAVSRDFVPPTINYEVPDPECDLDYVPNRGRETVVNYALSNSFGFGGTNATLLIKKYTEGP